MKRFLIFVVFCAGIFVLFFVFPKGAVATIFSSAIVISMLLVVERVFEPKNADFLKKVFLVALLLRVCVALMIYLMEWELYFGPDAETYDLAGRRIVGYWTGMMDINSWGVEKAISFNQSGWGMNYFVGIVYYLSGRNQLAIQFVSCSLGAATVPAVYYCAAKIFNTRAAKYSALAIALFPAMVIWSSQLLKDGFILFFLVVSMACIIELHEKVDYPAIFILLLSLFGLLAFRSYIFYIVTAAAIGSFVIVAGKTPEAMIKRLGALLFITTAVVYFGLGSDQETSKDIYTLDRLQIYRQYQSEGEGSGFGEDYDISTVEGKVTLLPVGIVYILFAPFPWQMSNARQILIAPEMLLWWLCIPFLIKGLWFTMKTRLRASIPILTFSAMLTIAYALFQSNIGAAYRQRTQIQVFLFIFIAVGWTLYKEKKENRDFTFKARRQEATSGF